MTMEQPDLEDRATVLDIVIDSAEGYARQLRRSGDDEGAEFVRLAVTRLEQMEAFVSFDDGDWDRRP